MCPPVRHHTGRKGWRRPSVCSLSFPWAGKVTLPSAGLRGPGHRGVLGGGGGWLGSYLFTSKTHVSWPPLSSSPPAPGAGASLCCAKSSAGAGCASAFLRREDRESGGCEPRAPPAGSHPGQARPGRAAGGRVARQLPRSSTFHPGPSLLGSPGRRQPAVAALPQGPSALPMVQPT